MYIFISAAAYYLPALLVMESKKGGDALISFLLARACNKPQHNLATSAPSQLHHPFLVFPWAFLKFNGNSEKDLGTSREHDSILLWKEMKKRTKRKKGNLLFVAVALLWDNGALRCEASQSVFHGSHLGALMHFPNQLSLIFFLMYLLTATRGYSSVVFNRSDLIYFYIKRNKCAVSNTTHKPILMNVLFVKSRAQSIFEMKIQIVWSCNLQRNCC